MARLNLDILLDTFKKGKQAFGLATIINSEAPFFLHSLPFSIQSLTDKIASKMSSDADLDTNVVVTDLHSTGQMMRTQAAGTALGLPVGISRKKMEDVGGLLYHAVFPKKPKTSHCLQNSLYFARGSRSFQEDPGKKIRIRLFVSDELAVLPWEWMYNPYDEKTKLGTNQFLILDDIPIVRYRGKRTDLTEQVTVAPVNILIVVADPKDRAKVEGVATETELEINETLDHLCVSKALHIKWVRGADTLRNWHRLQDTGFQPHIVLIISHGETDAQDNYLIFGNYSVSSAGLTGVPVNTCLSADRTCWPCLRSVEM